MLWSQGWLRAAGTYPGFCSMKRLEVFLLPLERTLGHRRSLPHNFARLHQKLADTHLYTWAERGTVQEHKTMSPARAQNQTARSGDERINHEAKSTIYLLNYCLCVAWKPRCLRRNESSQVLTQGRSSRHSHE